jgi:hypothetical protein
MWCKTHLYDYSMLIDFRTLSIQWFTLSCFSLVVWCATWKFIWVLIWTILFEFQSPGWSCISTHLFFLERIYFNFKYSMDLFFAFTCFSTLIIFNNIIGVTKLPGTIIWELCYYWGHNSVVSMYIQSFFFE